MSEEVTLKRLSDTLWEIPREGDMLVPGRIYGDDEIIGHLRGNKNTLKEWDALLQVKNVACLPGIMTASYAMADIHPGYGFCIGGVGAFSVDEGIVSVAGVGFDCNCGVRVMKTDLSIGDVTPKKEDLANALYRDIPAGLGSTGSIRLSKRDIDKVLIKGAVFAVNQGFGEEEDLEYCEEQGAIKGAKPENVSDKAKQRQFRQVGTLGSGNHYLEVQVVEEIFDTEAANAYGICKDQVLISIHCGSRALGHQIGTDYLPILEKASRKYKIPIRERELVCAPIKSEEGQRYLSAVNGGINCAFANRQVLGHLARKCFARVLSASEDSIRVLYDVGHNTAKIETHTVNGRKTELLVHRKGVTRAFGPGCTDVPERYQKVGQPVFVGGTMGTSSYILKGTARAMEETFGSTIHGAGRALSRHEAKKRWNGKEIIHSLAQKGIIVKGHSISSVAEEAPGAYKDVNRVVGVMHKAGVNLKVARVRPVICVKG
ncbi:MAG: RtcB family protein [Candidatus Theseobacter exili]|nr:RtcB family protein [Candidatus Theseobacter exili]